VFRAGQSPALTESWAGLLDLPSALQRRNAGSLDCREETLTDFDTTVSRLREIRWPADPMSAASSELKAAPRALRARSGANVDCGVSHRNGRISVCPERTR